MHRWIVRGVIAALAVLPSAALAHTGAGATSGFVQGFAHPLGGMDHVFAMVAIGLFAFQLGGRALWAVPGTFVAVMALGGLLGASGIPVPHVELGVALSVAALGVLVAVGVKAPLAVAMTLAAVFAVFHGHAHGSEMVQEGGALTYAAGFLLATAMLHGVGLALGTVAAGRLAFRTTGTAVAVAGVVLVTGLL